MEGVLDERLDPEVAEVLRRFPQPREGFEDIPALRAAWRRYAAETTSRSAPQGTGVAVEDRTVPSLVDDHAIPVRVYRPAAPASGRGLVFVHGGAFVMGDLDEEDVRCRVIAEEAACVIVSVDYRLAPEHRFPTGLDDCHSALRWVAANAAELSIDPGRLAVGGCSAGGALAAALAIRCRDEGGPSLALQLLLSPVLDLTRVASRNAGLSEQDLRDNELYHRQYFGAATTRSRMPVLASPALCAELAGLAPTYVAVAALDALRDEAIVYAQRLLDAGVSVELHMWPRVPHAFELTAPDAAVTRAAVREQAQALVRGLG